MRKHTLHIISIIWLLCFLGGPSVLGSHVLHESEDTKSWIDENTDELEEASVEYDLDSDSNDDDRGHGAALVYFQHLGDLPLFSFSDHPTYKPHSNDVAYFILFCCLKLEC